MHDQITYFGPESQYLAEVQHRLEARAMMSSGRDEPKEAPYNLQGAVAVVDITGSLINGTAGFMSYFGYTGYGDIRNSLVAAVSDPAVGSILLNVDSGGGQVAGVHELAQLIARVDKVKPVVTYTGGTMASAALWLGAGGRKVVATQTAMVGSLGILQIHIDRTKQLEMDGIKATVIRAGEEKALNNPYEPLSEAGKAGMQAQADEMYSVFLGHVAAQRKLPVATAEKQFGGGRVFVGQQALSANLVDELGGFEAAYAAAAKFAERAMKKTSASNIPNVRADRGAQPLTAAHNTPIATPSRPNMHEDLSPDALAALAGVDLSDPAAPAATGASADAALVEAQAELATAQATLTATQAELATAQAELATAKEALAAATAAVADLTAQTETLTAEAAAAKPQFEAAIEIARASVRTMGVSFGVAAEAVAAMSAAEVLENHKSLAEKFRAKYKIKTGGVAAASLDPQPSQPKAALVDPLFAARVNRHQ